MAKKASKRNRFSSIEQIQDAVRLNNASVQVSESQPTANTLLGRLMARIDALENQQQGDFAADCSTIQSVASVPRQPKTGEQSEQGVRSSVLRLMSSVETFEKLVTSVYEKFSPVLDFSVGLTDSPGSVSGVSGAMPSGGCQVSCAINEQVNRIDNTIRKLQELMNGARLD